MFKTRLITSVLLVTMCVVYHLHGVQESTHHFARGYADASALSFAGALLGGLCSKGSFKVAALSAGLLTLPQLASDIYDYHYALEAPDLNNLSIYAGQGVPVSPEARLFSKAYFAGKITASCVALSFSCAALFFYYPSSGN